ncbi:MULTISPECIES: hypothetical protein [Paenibacillus]|uniref:Uncharacterized protein n=1 Tax=Paenibacillus alvei TaxID=44250 RepID=A0ABT4ECB2_PAEAL|nr:MULTISPECIES: hypothetical protein [Paenibacillus]EPY13674.1 CMP/dCMP deaminase zinc-binding protein [Paenibacillus alvei A6-6i-x]MCY9530133.1 hypothetical protein [Paenibacillus alvei]SDF63139.1 hypothetical protein SAMN04488689_10619 [Paenibacillus sp. cl6col]
MINFETMIETAKSVLAEELPLQNSEMPPQATVLLTDHGNVHVAICRDVFGSDCGYVNLINTLKNKGESRVLQMVTMWKNGTVDSPSMNLIKSIYEMNKENLETEVMLFGKKHDDPEELPLRNFISKLKYMIIY